MKKYIFNFLVLAIVAGLSSCIKNKFDAPPAGGVDPNIKVNFSIDSVKARFTGQPYQFTQNLVISGIVSADDRSGNFYKAITLQDSTGGIMLSLDASYLYNNYPVGRRLFINLKNLWVVNYKGTYELIAFINTDGSYGGLTSSLFTQYITPGKWGVPIVPIDVPINQLSDKYQSMLIELDRVEFEPLSGGRPYADGYNLLSGTLNITDCIGYNIALYTSGFANFANSKAPRGNGKLLAIYGTYAGTPQLTIRDTTDVQFDGLNCNGASNGTYTIAQLRAKYTSTPVVLPAGYVIQGTVISDVANGNLSAKNMVLQDTTGGISVRFAASHNFNLGDVVMMDLSGDTIYPYKGWLQVSTVSNTNCIIVGTGTYVTPRVATIADINTNASRWESTLIQIDSASLIGGNSYSGNLTIKDGSGVQAIFYTSSYASFAGAPVPPTPKTITVILEQYNGPQLQIRNLSDVQ